MFKLHGGRVLWPATEAERQALWPQTKPAVQTIPANATIATGKVVHGMTAQMIVDTYERLMRDEGRRPTEDRVAEEFFMSGRNLRRRMRALEMPSWPPVLPRGS